MRFFVLLILLFFFIPSWALEYQVGDVIVQSFDCYECRLIQSETNSPFVHSGVVLKDAQGELKVAEALGPVALVPLKKFLSRGKLNAIYRSKELSRLSSDEKSKLLQEMLETFSSQFAGLAFDNDFLWDNRNSQGQETFYCAEFVAKFLNHFLQTSILPEPMSYKKNYEQWQRIFRGRVPEGLPGLSPSFFTRSSLFEEVKE